MKEMLTNFKETVINSFLPKCEFCNTAVKPTGMLTYLQQSDDQNSFYQQTIFQDENKALIIFTQVPWKGNELVRNEVMAAGPKIERSVVCPSCVTTQKI